MIIRRTFCRSSPRWPSRLPRRPSPSRSRFPTTPGRAHRHRAAGDQGRARAAALRPDDARPARAGRRASSSTAKGAVVETLNYGPAPDFQAELDKTDIYIWLPAGATRRRRRRSARSAGEVAGRRQGPPDPLPLERRHRRIATAAPARTRRTSTGSTSTRSTSTTRKLSRGQDKAIAKLRSGEVRVTTPGGTDIRFTRRRSAVQQAGRRRVEGADGPRPRCASIARSSCRPGVIRVAPIETSAPTASSSCRRRACSRRGGDRHPARVRQRQGRQGDGRRPARRTLDAYPRVVAGADVVPRARPRLQPEAGRAARDSAFLPYYGYGDAVVRLSLGDNTEVGGAVRGGGSRWLFFDDTTITVGGDTHRRERPPDRGLSVSDVAST